MTTRDLALLLKHARCSAGYKNPYAAAKALSVNQWTYRRWEQAHNLDQIAAFLSVIEQLGFDITIRKRGQS